MQRDWTHSKVVPELQVLNFEYSAPKRPEVWYAPIGFSIHHVSNPPAEKTNYKKTMIS